MRISTQYKTVNGKGKVLARSGGKQLTTVWDHSRTVGQNHGDAAGNLAVRMVEGDTARHIAADTAKVIGVEPFKMRFSLGE